MMTVSSIETGRVTFLMRFSSEVEKPNPSVNMRKTTPSCPIVLTDCVSTRKLPPHVLALITTPAKM